MVKTLRVESGYEVLESYLQCSSSQNIRKWVTQLFPKAFDMKLVALIPTCVIEWELILRETQHLCCRHMSYETGWSVLGG